MSINTLISNLKFTTPKLYYLKNSYFNSVLIYIKHTDTQPIYIYNNNNNERDYLLKISYKII